MWGFDSVLGASVTSFKSTEAEESRKAFTVAVEAAKNVVRSFKKAWNTAKTVWSNELGDESKIETTDEYFKRAGSAINNIAKSEVFNSIIIVCVISILSSNVCVFECMCRT